jgi:tRNA 2-thiouridine synthesizing protein A
VSVPHDELWDAGDMSCGDLVLQLRQRLRSMPGRTLKVIARDPGAPADLPAFCRMTGDKLLAQDQASQTYWIQSRDRGASA